MARYGWGRRILQAGQGYGCASVDPRGSGLSTQRNAVARAFVAAMQAGGVGAHIANLDTAVELLDWGGHALPVTINTGARQHCFVTSPRVGYVDYVRHELAHFPNPALVPLLRPVVAGVAGLLRLAGSERIVHVNNWMMSTNLPAPLDPALTAAQTRALIARFPTHLLAMRSLTRANNAALMDALQAAGWVLLPARQIFTVDDVARDSLTRRDAKNDDRLWRESAFAYDELTAVSADDAARIAHLYDLLYLRKYSRLNPVYTPRFIAMSAQIGMIRYLVLRDGDGVIQGFGGMHSFDGHATMPLIGYDTGADRKLGLYRLVCHMGALYAARHGLRFNMSSGAGSFKLTRGARPAIEYTAYYLRHLPLRRRLPFGLLRGVADRVGVPLLERYQL